MGNRACLLFSQRKGVLALITTLEVKSEAAVDDATSGLVCEWCFAGNALIELIIFASWFLFDASLFFG